MSTEITVVNDIVEINVTEDVIVIEAPSGAYPLPTGVYTVFGRTGNVVAQDGDYNLTQLGDVTITSPATGQVLRYNGTTWVNSTESYIGTVTSVNASVPTGMTISGNPITTSGTLAFGLASGYVIPTQSELDAKALKATTITIDGTTHDLSANSTYQVLPIGGTTGQILAKNSATNYDTLWIDNYTEQLRDTVKAAVVINKGQAVYISGATGNNQIVSLASNVSEATSSKTLGLANQNFAINDIGQIITEGLITGIDTSTATAGDPVWLGVNGNLIFGLANKPAAPAHLVYIGVVTRVQLNNGEIYVKIQNGFELQELHNVSITSPANGNILQYDATTSLWKNVAGTTTNIAEGTNLYYTDARARGAISLTTTGTSGAATYNSTTGVLNIPNYSETTFGTVTSVGLSSSTSGVTIGSSPITTSGTITLAIATASGSQQGLLSSTDWTTFNNKQDALTNPVTGTGTTNTLPKFTGTSAIGNSNITDTGSLITLGSNSYINGALGIGSTPSTNINLLISKNITGNVTSYALYHNGTIQSDVTTSAIFNATFIGTAAASFTLNNAYGNYVAGTTIGAGSAISTQQAYYVHSNFTGATNNYGFRGAIPSGTGRWNLYMDGTADNYINGSLGIGNTTLSGNTLRVSRPITGSIITYGIRQEGQVQSDVTNQANGFYNSLNTAAAAFTLSNYFHFRAFQGTIGASSSVSIQTGFQVDSNLIGATTNYGFRGQIPAQANAWNIYMDGTANNYLAGSLGIGTTSLTGLSLNVAKNITGAATSYGIYSSGQIQSDVTTIAYMYRSFASTAAATFTLTDLIQYNASQGTFGAGSTITSQYGFHVSPTMIGATNNYGFFGNIASGTGRWNLFMNGTADNYLAGSLGIGSVQVNGGPILTITLTSGGSGYVDGTYTDVAMTGGGGNGALATFVVSGGIVTTATLTWGGANYIVGGLLSAPNTSLGGTGSGLSITVAAVDSSQFSIGSATGGDITLFRNDTTLSPNDNVGTIKWMNNDTTVKAGGLIAEIGAFGAGSSGGAYLSFLTRSGIAGTSLVEAMRIGSEGSVGIGATSLTGNALFVAKNITGATTAWSIQSTNDVSSDVTSLAIGFGSSITTSAAAFTLASLMHFRANGRTLGAGSSMTNQYGYVVESGLTQATNNYGFYGNIPNATNRWNLYMNGTASNYLAGSLGIGSTALTGYTLRLAKSITGGTSVFAVRQEGTVQSDVTSDAVGFRNDLNTTGSAFTLTNYFHYYAIQNTIGAGSAVTNQYGYAVTSSMTGATNNYGFHGGIASGTGRWNLYMAGTADNHLGGKLTIGSATTSSNSIIYISRQITGGVSSNGIIQELNVSSDVTTQAFANRTILGTVAASFTLPILSHYVAGQGTIGAGSTVTTQIGYWAQSNMIGATTNVGFYGDIASGTNRWNLYMNGTAQNYLAGNTGIGVAAKTTAELSLGAGTTAQAQINLASSTAPTTPNDGDIWFDGTALKIRIGGVTKTFTVI